MNKTNKFLFILGVATALFTSCSSDDTLETSKGPELTEDEKWVLEANSDERIELGSGDNSFTRAFVGEGESSTLFTTNEGIGVFCLASAKINPKDPKVPEIKWDQYTNSDLTKRNEGRYMNWMGMNTGATLDDPDAGKTTNFVTWGGNVYANAYQPHRDEVSGDDVTRISWGDSLTRFYPMGNWYTYTFYGYHPYQWNATNNVKTTSEKVDVTIPIDGFTDVLWGRSYRPSDGTVETADSCAYSGKYFRQYRKAHSTEAPTPTMVFKHALSRINFMVGRGDSPANSGSIYITELKLLGNVPNSVNLNVATLAAAPNVKPKPTDTDYFNGDPVNKAEGKVTTSSTTYLKTSVPDGFKDDGSINYKENQYGVDLPYAVTYNTANVITKLSTVDKKKRQVTINKADMTPNYQQLGTGIIVPPTTATPDYKVQLTIELEREEGDPLETKTYTFIPQFPYPISFPGALEQGKQYNVYITVYTPQDIRINAELVEWDKVDVVGEGAGIEI